MPGGAAYTSGNLEKRSSRNPLKRRLSARLDERLCELVAAEAKAASLAGRPARVLDAGCGEGVVTALIASAVSDADVTGVDASAAAIGYARERHGEVTAFCEGDILDLPFEDVSFDVVVCSEVLEHVSQFEKAAAELARVCAHSIVLSVPHEPWFCLGNLLALKNVTRLGNPADHVNHWTGAGFRRMAQERFPGFEVTFSTSFPWSLAVLRRGDAR